MNLDSLEFVDPLNCITTAPSASLESSLIAYIKLGCNAQDQNNYDVTRHSSQIGNIHTNDEKSGIRYLSHIFHD